jgi:tetratricopeptide (TPR) repeat protein
MSDYDTSIRLNPNFARAYQTRYSTREQLGDIKGASADLTEVIRLKPDEAARLYANRAELYLKLKNTSLALADYTEAIRLAPNITSYTDPRFASYSGYELRAKLRYELKDYRGAIADYTQVIRLAPSGSAFDGAISSDTIWADAYYKRADAHEKVGDRKAAIEDYRQAARYYRAKGLTNYAQKAMQQISRLLRN